MNGRLLKQSNLIDPTCKACPLHQGAKCVSMRGKAGTEGEDLMVWTDWPDYFADNAGKPYAMDTGKILDWMFRCLSIDPARVAYDYTVRCFTRKSDKHYPSTKAKRAHVIEECAHFRFARIAKVKPKALAVLGQLSFEAFTGKGKLGEYEGQQLTCWEPIIRQYCETCWIGYSIQYCLVSPSDTYRVFRVLYMAAKQAGLNPIIDPTVPPFNWRIIK